MPTEYKPNHISIEYEDGIVVDKTPDVDYQSIIDKMQEHLDEALRIKDARTEVKRKDYKDNFDMYWYANAGSAFHKIKSDPRRIVEEMTDDDFTKYIIYHKKDTMNIDEKLMLLSHIYDNKYDMKNKVKQYTKQYFEKKMVDVPEKNQKLIVLAYVINNETTTYSSYVAKQDKLEKWTIVSPEREKDYIAYYSFMKVPYNKFNNVIGLFLSNINQIL